MGPTLNKREAKLNDEKEHDKGTESKKNNPEIAREHLANKLAFTTGPVELARNLKAGEKIVVVDVREAEDYKLGHIPGAINLPHDQWSTCKGLSTDMLNVVYCYTHVCH